MREKEAKKYRNKAKLISFYPRKTAFFALLVLVSLFGKALISSNIFSANIPNDYFGTNTSSKRFNIEVTERGKIFIDGKESSTRINYLDDSDELRLVVADNLGQYISTLNVSLKLPAPVANNVKTDFLGIHGVGETNVMVLGKDSISYEAINISPAATLTVVAKMPKGTIKPVFFDRILSMLISAKSSFWIAIAILFPVLTFLLMTAFVLYIQRRQRVDIPKSEIANPPMAIPPAVVGVLFNQKVGSREIAATLIDLALRGDLVILDQDRGFAFGKGRFDQRLLEFEKALLSKIFKDKITSNKIEIEERVNSHLYSKRISLAASGIYSLATMLGYFKVNPQKSHAKYRMIGLAFFLLGFAGFCLNMFFFKEPAYLVFFWVGMMISSLVIVLLASRLPTRTVIGQEVLSNWLAFKKFLSNPQKIPFSENNQEIFQRYLPYAIVLNCETAWAKRFSEHNFIIPDWFLTEKNGLGLEDFCLSLFPIVSYVSRSLVALNEPGFD